MNSEEHSTRFFFDSYALIEIFRGNENYAKYLDALFFVTKLNLFEYHQFLLKVIGKDFADSEIEKFSLHLKLFDLAVIKKASAFRDANKIRSISMTDAIGYVFSLENGLVFLTGDRQFIGMKNVEFVK